MLTQLRAARADNSHERCLARLGSIDLLIIDDLGLRGLTGEEPLDLYDIIRQRCERASTIITSNRGVEEWAPLFRDPLLASAAIDRLRHHAHIIEISGDSYRNPPPGKAAVDQFCRSGGRFSEAAIGGFQKPALAISSADLTTDQFCRPLTILHTRRAA